MFPLMPLISSISRTTSVTYNRCYRYINTHPHRYTFHYIQHVIVYHSMHTYYITYYIYLQFHFFIVTPFVINISLSVSLTNQYLFQPPFLYPFLLYLFLSYLYLRSHIFLSHLSRSSSRIQSLSFLFSTFVSLSLSLSHSI